MVIGIINLNKILYKFDQIERTLIYRYTIIASFLGAREQEYNSNMSSRGGAQGSLQQSYQGQTAACRGWQQRATDVLGWDHNDLLAFAFRPCLNPGYKV